MVEKEALRTVKDDKIMMSFFWFFLAEECHLWVGGYLKYQLVSAISGGDNKFNIIAQWQMLFILGWISLLTLLRQ